MRRCRQMDRQIQIDRYIAQNPPSNVGHSNSHGSVTNRARIQVFRCDECTREHLLLSFGQQNLHWSSELLYSWLMMFMFILFYFWGEDRHLYSSRRTGAANINKIQKQQQLKLKLKNMQITSRTVNTREPLNVIGEKIQKKLVEKLICAKNVFQKFGEPKIYFPKTRIFYLK